MSSYGVNLVSLIQVTTLALVAVAQFRSRANRMCILRDVRPKDLCWGLYICPAQSALIVVVCNALRTRVAHIYIYFYAHRGIRRFSLCRHHATIWSVVLTALGAIFAIKKCFWWYISTAEELHCEHLGSFTSSLKIREKADRDERAFASASYFANEFAKIAGMFVEIKCVSIRLLTIKNLAFFAKYTFEFMLDLGNPTINKIQWSFPRG